MTKAVLFASHRMTADAQTKLGASILKRGTSLQNDIHRLAVAVALDTLHTDLGGNLNIDKVPLVITSMSAGMPRNKIVNWFAVHTNVRIAVSGGGKTVEVSLLKPGMEGHRELTEENVNTFINEPYWMTTPEEDVSFLDVDKMIGAAIKKLSAAIKDGKVANKDDATKKLAALQRLAPAKA